MNRLVAQPYVALVVGLAGVILAASVAIGADTMWMVAMGDLIVRGRSVPVGVPFAAAPTQAWPNVPVLGELVFSGLHRMGGALPAAQVIASTASLALLGWGASREGASQVLTAPLLTLTFVGALASFGVVRAQLLSLVPFVAMLLLVRSEHRHPSGLIWMAVPILLVWGNLHGAALVGLALVGCYLVFSRLWVQRRTAIAVGLASVVALFINPAHVHVYSYYLGVLQNEAALRGSQLWAAPDVSNASDLLMVVCAAVLLGLALSLRLAIWEYVAAAGLAVATMMARRNALWLLVFLLIPAAKAATTHWRNRRRSTAEVITPERGATWVVAVTLGLLAMSMIWSRADGFQNEERQARTLTNLTAGHIVLAPDRVAESMAAAGARLWAGNPIDAFAQIDQSAYLDFLEGEGAELARALNGADAVIAQRGSPSQAAAEAAGYAVVDRVGDLVVMFRSAAPGMRGP